MAWLFEQRFHMGGLSTDTEALMSGKVRRMLSGEALFLLVNGYPLNLSIHGGGVSLVFSFKGTREDSTLLSTLSLTGLPLNTSPQGVSFQLIHFGGHKHPVHTR